MQETVSKVVQEMPGGDESLPMGTVTRLQQLAARIATITISHYHGQLLYRGLEMARAVAEFDYELDNPSDAA